MKILITGITGLLGSELADVLSEGHELTGIASRSSHPSVKTYNIDISDKAATCKTITGINPDIVIHSAAMSNVDECERNPGLALRINGIGTKNIALACQRFDTALLNVSTDYVFSGDNGPKEGYKEFDAQSPLSEYAKSKSAGEWFVRHLLNKFYIVRTSWLFGKKRTNFVSDIAEKLKTKNTINAVSDMISSPTHVSDLSQAISELIKTSSYGVYHLSNNGFASRYEIAITIAEMMGYPKTLIKKLSLKDLKLPAKRPSFSALRNYMWEMEGYKPLRSWQSSVKEFLLQSGYLKK